MCQNLKTNFIVVALYLKLVYNKNINFDKQVPQGYLPNYY